MPFLKLQFRQGLNRDQTNYTGEGGWWDGDKIRFFSGFPQKVGGWAKATSETFIGTCRQLFNWITSYADNLLAVGTNQKVYIEVGGYFYDITPLREAFTTSSSPSSDDCIDTTNASTTVTVNITGHGCLTGDYVTISGVTGDPGGIPDAEINAEHIVTRVDADNFTFVVTTAATSTTTNGGGTAIVVECQIHPGFASVTEGYGWGTGSWQGSEVTNTFGWGLASPIPVDQPQQDWWFDNFDNDLVLNIRSLISVSGAPVGGIPYIWERGLTVNPTTALTTRAIPIASLGGASAVPDQVGQLLVSQNDKHLLAFGARPYYDPLSPPNPLPAYDPLLIRWASQDEPQMWEPLPTNSAGFIRVSRGSKIVRAIPNRQEIVVLTNSSVYSLQFLGTSDVFGLQELADNISIISPRAVTTTNNITYWMGVDKFYMYDGRVRPLPTTVREYVFRDINFAQADQIISGTNEGFNEIWWFYPSNDSVWNDRYVVYNYLDNCWYFGTIVRTAWLDTPLRSNPFAASTPPPAEPINAPFDQDPGILYQHEFGVNDDEAPMVSYIQSNDFDIQQNDGETFMLTRRIIPDINFNGSTSQAPEVEIAVRSRNFPGSQFQTDPSDNQRVIETSFGLYTNQVFVRARGRQLALRVGSDDLGVQWQLGSPRLDARPDGKQ
jgi:hypothetical protein